MSFTSSSSSSSCSSSSSDSSDEDMFWTKLKGKEVRKKNKLPLKKTLQAGSVRSCEFSNNDEFDGTPSPTIPIIYQTSQSGFDHCYSNPICPKENNDTQITPASIDDSEILNDPLNVEIGDYVSFNSYSELKAAIKEHEINSTRFIFKKKSLSGASGFSIQDDVNLDSYLNHINDVDAIKLNWDTTGRKGDKLIIRCNDLEILTPFIYLNNCDYFCHRGKDLGKKNNEKVKQKKMSTNTSFKSRAGRPSKKTGCPAKFTVKQLLYFPDFAVSMNAGRKKRHQKMKELRKALKEFKSKLQSVDHVGDDDDDDDDIDFQIPCKKFKTSCESDLLNINYCLVYITKFPLLTDHNQHPMGLAERIEEKKEKNRRNRKQNPLPSDHNEHPIMGVAADKGENDKDVLEYIKNFARECVNIDANVIGNTEISEPQHDYESGGESSDVMMMMMDDDDLTAPFHQRASKRDLFSLKMQGISYLKVITEKMYDIKKNHNVAKMNEKIKELLDLALEIEAEENGNG